MPVSAALAAPARALRRSLALLLVLATFTLGWAGLTQQHHLLWARVATTAADRFMADRITAPLPALPPTRLLAEACAEPPAGWRTWRRSTLRAALGECLAQSERLVQGAAATQALARYEALLAAQASAATAWLSAYEAQAAPLRQREQTALAGLAAPAGPASGVPSHTTVLKQMVDTLVASLPIQPTTQRSAVGPASPVDAAALRLRSALQETQARQQALAALPLPQRLQGTALLATGLQLQWDYGVAPPAPALETDRRALADVLEWQRKAAGFSARGFNLADLRELPAALAWSSLLGVLVALWASRGRATVVAAWAAVGLMLGAGALVLTDLALAGDPALRLLAERQFLRFGLGEATLPLTITLPLGDAPPLRLWWPLLVAAAGLAAMRGLRDGRSVLLAPVRGWMHLSEAGQGWSLLPMLLLFAAGAASVLFLGMPAAVSELLVALAVLGLATYLARQAPLANLGAGLQPASMGIVLAALLSAVGGSLARGDLGHVLVALMLAGCFVGLFGGRWLRLLLAVAMLAGLAVLGWCLWTGELAGPLAWAGEHLPPHARDRLQAQFQPLQAGASDLARVRWLIDSAGTTGWGPGYVPWQGLAPGRTQDGLPLQGPSDYVLALYSALWGRLGGLAWLSTALLLFGGSAALGLRSALQPAMPVAARWLAAVGGFGCLVMAFKVVLSVGGVTGVLPLTGLPVALLGYGPVTHLAALMYLVLALGVQHLQPAEQARGVDLATRPALPGAARLRGAVLGVAGLAGLAALIGLGERLLGRGPAEAGQPHVASARLAMAQAISQALVPPATAAEADASATPAACPALGHAVAAWNARLSTLSTPVRLPGQASTAVPAQALRLDPTRLLGALPPQEAADCPRLARQLGRMLDGDLPRLVGRALPATVSDDTRHLLAFDRPRALGARPADYSTANAWWGLPGCLFTLAASSPTTAAGCRPGQTPASGRLAPGQLEPLGLTDAWLQRDLVPALHLALRRPQANQEVNHREVAVGPALGLSLDPRWQPLAERLVDCYAGRSPAADCTEVLPRNAAWRSRHFDQPQALRAGAIGLVLVQVSTGRVVAMAGAVSDCTLAHLGREAKPDAEGRLAALRPGQRCAQLPDRRSAWLALQHPALWMLPPGSSLKELAVLAGIDAGLVPAGRDAAWKAILAESHERLPVQRVALAAGPRYLQVLQQAGFGQGPLDLMWGGARSRTLGPVGWASNAYAGTEGLRATTMTLDEAERIRQEKLAGANVDQRYGRAVMTEFIAARQLADASVGGGDIRINALGLARLWRAIDLRATGRAEAAEPHLIEGAGRPVPTQRLDWASPGASRRVLDITSGVTASAWRGTAQGSCRVVFGGCPAQGLPGLSGKTGSADFLVEEDSPWVKPGQQLPAKLFGGVFTAGDGQRYAIATMALRVRDGDKATLELSPSAPAEAALTLMREMGAAPAP